MALQTAAEVTSAAGAPRVLLLADDIWDMPDDGKRYEVIEGRLYVTTAPDLDHQEPSMALSGFLWPYLQQNPLGRIYAAPVGLILDEHNGIQPDLVYISRERRAILTRRGIRGVPDLVVEILSPGTEHVDRGVKWRRYAAAGVPHYWLIAPETRTLEEYRLGETGYALVGTYAAAAGDVFRPSLFPGLEIPIAALWPPL
jgi:Uma2 family endonuclease